MQFITFLISTLTLISAAVAGVIEERAGGSGILYCAGQPYYPWKYTCYGTLLCPIISGTIYQPCGKACFDPSNYRCNNGVLTPVGVCNGQVYDKNSVSSPFPPPSEIRD